MCGAACLRRRCEAAFRLGQQGSKRIRLCRVCVVPALYMPCVSHCVFPTSLPAASLSEGEKRYSRFESGNRYGDTPFANKSSKVSAFAGL